MGILLLFFGGDHLGQPESCRLISSKASIAYLVADDNGYQLSARLGQNLHMTYPCGCLTSMQPAEREEGVHTEREKESE